MKIKPIENQIIRYACLFVGVLLIDSELDNDCWFLFNHGRYVIEQGIPYIEPFTIHENFAFVMQQWLTGVVFWEIYQYFHAEGLILFLYPMGALTIYAIYCLTLMMSKGNKDTALVLSSLAGLAIGSFFIRTRPQIFSTLIFIMEIIALEILLQRNDRRYLLLFPFLSLVLINMHAAMWPLMLVFLLPFFMEHLTRYDKKGYFLTTKIISLYDLGIIAMLIFLAGFINPYGWDAMTYVFRSYGFDLISSLVGEMKPITIRTVLGKMSFLLFVLVIVIYTHHKLAVRHWLLTLGTMVMALSSYRSLYLFLTVGLYPLAYVYRDWQGFGEQKEAAGNTNFRKIIIFMITSVFIWAVIKNYNQIVTLLESQMILSSLALFLVAAFAAFEWKYGSLHLVSDIRLRFGYVIFIASLCFSLLMVTENKIEEAKQLPAAARAADYILEHEQSGNVRLWTDYNEGPYMEFRGLRCFLDARAEVFLPTNNKQRDILYEYVSLQTGRTDYRTFLSWYDFNYILVSENDIMYTYLPSDENYELVLDYSDESGKKFCLYHARL